MARGLEELIGLCGRQAASAVIQNRVGVAVMETWDNCVEYSSS
jgi:hypothetical protein